MMKIYTARLALWIPLTLGACDDGSQAPGGTNNDCRLEVPSVQCSESTRTGGKLQPFSAPTGAAAVKVTAAADAQARSGIPFDPNGTPVVVDGWAITFTSILLTVDHLQLIDNPDHAAGESELVVAEARGPFAVDVLQPAATLATLSKENLTCDVPPLEDRKYGFSYDVVTATHCAKNVNLAGGAVTDYAEMVASGYSVMFSGIAQFKGLDNGNTCDDNGIDHSMWPTSVAFRFGAKQAFKAGNCSGGVTVRGQTGGASAEISVRSHLLFADALAESGTELYFDQIAARYATGSATSALARVEDFSGVSFSPFSQLNGDALTWRVCSAGSSANSAEMAFDAKGAPVSNYGDYLQQGILKQVRYNGNGTCDVRPPTPESASEEEPVRL